MTAGPAFRVPSGFFDESGSYPRAAKVSVREVTVADDEYPPLLREIDHVPKRLWVIGRDLRELGPFVAVIGARRATQYGLDHAARIAADLAANGVCVVSGMARGADAAAHQGALSVGGNTVAMLGCGPDLCYPSGSRALYAAIAERGAIVSEHPPGHSVHKSGLKDRNRILVGISHAVVVIQGHAGSAAVATGKAAADQNRLVFAVPGQIDWEMSAGVHWLLRQGATVCTGAGEVLQALQTQTRLPLVEHEPFVPPHLPEQEKRILQVLENEALSTEAIVARAGLGVVEGIRAVSALEILGLVRRTGSIVRRTR